MSRFLEGIFVIGCSLVGLGMGAPEGSGMQNTMQASIQLVALAQNHVTSNVARLSANFSHASERILSICVFRLPR